MLKSKTVLNQILFKKKNKTPARKKGDEHSSKEADWVFFFDPKVWAVHFDKKKMFVFLFCHSNTSV